jgi:hypothetical protein
MILVLLIWSLICFILFVSGYAVVKLIRRIGNSDESINSMNFDEFFFSGFLVLSVLTGFLSIFIPVGNLVLLILSFVALIIFLIYLSEFKSILKELIRRLSSLKWLDIAILLFIIFFVLTAVVQNITLGDTQSYHAQSIQWTRKFAVVPGLGNLHSGLAFNSMFFVISALFTFQFKAVLIFPLNGICYLILIIKLLSLFRKENKIGSGWKAVFYMLTFLVSFFMLIPNLNSPSPDIICGILIIYVFILILENSGRENQVSLSQVILINAAVLSCIGFKLSTVFMTAALLFLLDREILKRGLITIITGILVISPFIIRNYFLSGYVVYPFPAVDIFNVDWKIPLENAISTKAIIESWAKISILPYPDVMKMGLSQWVLPWFRLLDLISKLIVIVNLFSVITFIIMIVRKDFFLAKIQLIIFINLAFWFIMAPDLRFAYGFFFLGFSLTFAYLTKLIELSAFHGILRYINVCLAVLLALVVFKRIMFPLDTFKTPSLWIRPAPFGTVKTKDYYSDFLYRVPDPEGGCFNTEIPCTNYPLVNVVKRGDNLQDGFKVSKINP